MSLLFWVWITIVRITSMTSELSWRRRSQSLKASSGTTLTGSLGGFGRRQALTQMSCDVFDIL